MSTGRSRTVAAHRSFLMPAPSSRTRRCVAGAMRSTAVLSANSIPDACARDAYAALSCPVGTALLLSPTVPAHAQSCTLREHSATMQH